MRIDAQPLDEVRVVALGGGGLEALVRIEIGLRPEHPSAKCALKIEDGLHRHREDHLLVELRPALRQRQPVLGEQVWVVEIERFVEGPAGKVVVDDLQIFIGRS
jgi:hypothetical protein